mmetsp:Transcript_73183/g.201970  ORF Transcript_73183/g.201970 Transcript_73183/m.201970 type:complete len:243 (-) Transcript_73183:737-1465(-)
MFCMQPLHSKVLLTAVIQLVKVPSGLATCRSSSLWPSLQMMARGCGLPRQRDSSDSHWAHSPPRLTLMTLSASFASAGINSKLWARASASRCMCSFRRSSGSSSILAGGTRTSAVAGNRAMPPFLPTASRKALKSAPSSSESWGLFTERNSTPSGTTPSPESSRMSGSLPLSARFSCSTSSLVFSRSCSSKSGSGSLAFADAYLACFSRSCRSMLLISIGVIRSLLSASASSEPARSWPVLR